MAKLPRITTALEQLEAGTRILLALVPVFNEGGAEEIARTCAEGADQIREVTDRIRAKFPNAVRAQKPAEATKVPA